MNRSYLFIVGILILCFGLVSCDSQPTGTENGDGADPFSHTLNPGVSNTDFVTNRDFDRLIVEIDYMPGARPTDDAINSLQDFLEQWLDKSEIIIEEPTEIPAGGQESYSASEVRDLEAEYRSTFSEPESGTLASYNIFVDGEFSNGNVLGIAYYNTSNAFFGETIDNISGGLGQPTREKIEATVFHHEYGHLFGLVNNGTDMQDDHHDEPNGAHCTDDECLMYYAVETTDFFANIFDGSVPELDAFCEADLMALKEE